MQNRPNRRPPARIRPLRQMPPYLIALIDILLIVLCLMIFALFDHVIPQPSKRVSQTPPPVSASLTLENTQAPAQSDLPATSQAPAASEQPAAVGDFSARFADKFTAGDVIQTATSYQSANVNITLTTHRDDEADQTYYIQDIYIRSIDCLRTLFAEDTFGKSIAEEVLDMSNRCNAIAAINSDYYGYGNAGIVIRNGELYRDKWEDGEEVLILFRDGTMRVYHDESELNIEQALADGAWQSFSFGPAFLEGDGQLRPEGYARTNHDPRTIIGMVEPGHYMFIVIDGRQTGYARGMTYTECAKLCQSLGLTTAYNLDGGRTSQMTFLGAMANQPYKDGRATSDIIYIADIAG